MARKKKDAVDPRDAEVTTGSPQNGDPFDPADEPAGPDDDSDPDRGPPPPDDEANLSPAELINKRFTALQQEMRDLMAARPAASAQPATVNLPPAPPVQEPDWDKLIFDNPKSALTQWGDKIKREVTQELTQRYQTETGQREFWSDFYRANPDLSGDSDLVQATMNKHLAELADLPVPQASKKLAELTRTRILGYARTMNGRQPAPRTNGRTAIEGAAPPAPRPRTPEVPKGPVTLGELLKQRRTARSRAIGA